MSEYVLWQDSHNHYMVDPAGGRRAEDEWCDPHDFLSDGCIDSNERRVERQDLEGWANHTKG